MNNPNKLSASEREFLLSELEKNNNSFELEETKEIDKHFIFFWMSLVNFCLLLITQVKLFLLIIE